MKSRASSTLWKNFDRLPRHVQDAARKQFRLWLDDPQHASVWFKPLRGTRLWSARVSDDYRAAGYFATDDEFVWVFIGPHHAYDRLLARR